MKIIPVSLITAGLLAPAMSLARSSGAPQTPPPATGADKPGPPRPLLERLLAADPNHDGLITPDECIMRGEMKHPQAPPAK